MGGAPYHENPEHKHLAITMSSVGISQRQIAAVLNISVDTLAKYYGEEMAAARGKANTQIAGKLYQKAMEGDTTCMIFWLKTQAQWQEIMKIETSVEIDLNYKISAKPMTAEDWIAEYARGEDSLGTATGATNSIDYVPPE